MTIEAIIALISIIGIIMFIYLSSRQKDLTLPPIVIFTQKLILVAFTFSMISAIWSVSLTFIKTLTFITYISVFSLITIVFIYYLIKHWVKLESVISSILMKLYNRRT